MFSLKSLLFIVAVAALGSAGLIYRTQLWASALVALTLVVVLLATCRAWFVPAGRTFWGSFALTGTLYLLIASYQPLQELHYNLPTTQVVVYALGKLQKSIPLPASPAPMGTGYYAPSYSFYATPGTYKADTAGLESGAPAPTSDLPASASSVAGESATNEATLDVQEVEGATATSESNVILGAPAWGAPTPPTVAYAAPMYSPTVYSFNRQALFEMATNRAFGDGFAAQARAFLWIAQCLWCLLLAFAMGMTCSCLFRSPKHSAG